MSNFLVFPTAAINSIPTWFVQVKKFLQEKLGSLDENDADGESDQDEGMIEEAQAELQHLDIALGKLAL